MVVRRLVTALLVVLLAPVMSVAGKSQAQSKRVSPVTAQGVAIYIPPVEAKPVAGGRSTAGEQHRYGAVRSAGKNCRWSIVLPLINRGLNSARHRCIDFAANVLARRV